MRKQVIAGQAGHLCSIGITLNCQKNPHVRASYYSIYPVIDFVEIEIDFVEIQCGFAEIEFDLLEIPNDFLETHFDLKDRVICDPLLDLAVL